MRPGEGVASADPGGLGSLLRHDTVCALGRLEDLPVPVLVLTGADDKMTRSEHSNRMAPDIGHSADLVIVPGAGHVVNRTRRTQANAALNRLLGRVRGAAVTPGRASG